MFRLCIQFGKFVLENITNILFDRSNKKAIHLNICLFGRSNKISFHYINLLNPMKTKYKLYIFCLINRTKKVNIYQFVRSIKLVNQRKIYFVRSTKQNFITKTCFHICLFERPNKNLLNPMKKIKRTSILINQTSIKGTRGLFCLQYV
jgi:hypothetical protein